MSESPISCTFINPSVKINVLKSEREGGWGGEANWGGGDPPLEWVAPSAGWPREEEDSSKL